MTAQLVWLLLSHSMLLGIGGALIGAGSLAWGLVFLVGTPLLRMALRFRRGHGYYLVGYVGEVGGDPATPSGMITRRSAPLRFAILLALEVALVAALWVAVLLRGLPSG